jgi:hypothetical protein
VPDNREVAFERLATLDVALASTIEDLIAARSRVKRLLDSRDSDASWLTLVNDEERPLVVELVTRSLSQLSDAGGKFRRAEAEALRADGLPMTKIASLFGVTRQRISSLLSGSRDAAGSVG